MSSPLLLSGQVDHRDERIDELELENETLRRQLSIAQAELHSAKKDNARAIAALRRQLTPLYLRRQLTPLYQALQHVFGEMDQIGDTTEVGSGSSKWNDVKQRLQPRMREVIDVLLLQGAMTRKQIASAIKMNYSNCVNNVIGPLIRMGWVIDNGSNLSLKQL